MGDKSLCPYVGTTSESQMVKFCEILNLEFSLLTILYIFHTRIKISEENTDGAICYRTLFVIVPLDTIAVYLKTSVFWKFVWLKCNEATF